MDDALTDIYAQCLERLEAGATVEECLAAYPQERAALEGLLRLAARLRALPRPAPLPAAARAAIATSVLAEVATQRNVSTSAARSTIAWRPPHPFDPSAMLAGILRALGYRGALSPLVLRLASAAIAVVLALVLGMGVFAAARAIINAIAPQPTATPMPTLAPAQTFTLDGPIEQIAPDGWVVNGIPVAIDAQTAIAGTPAIGAVAHLRGLIQADGTLLAQQVTIAASPTPASSAASPAATAVPPAPTAASLPTATSVPPSPVPALATSGDPFEQLRTLIIAGIGDGRAGPHGDELLKRLNDAQEALIKGETKPAGDRLRDMNKWLQDRVRDGKINVAFAQQVAAGIDRIASTYGLQTQDDKPPKPPKPKP
jgi:hypothetical protein